MHNQQATYTLANAGLMSAAIDAVAQRRGFVRVENEVSLTVMANADTMPQIREAIELLNKPGTSDAPPAVEGEAVPTESDPATPTE